MSNSSGIIRRIFNFILLIGFLGGGIYLFYNGNSLYQAVVDDGKFNSYTPTPEIAAINQRLNLTKKGNFYFYKTHPALKTATEFNELCRQHNHEKQVTVLGCYIAKEDHIALFNLNKQELDGVKEVTAAHEMLHAVFRNYPTNSTQFKELEQELLKAYRQSPDNDFKQRMAVYDKLSQYEFVNELHSILATENKDIGEYLENYYKQFFNDRSAVVNLHLSYKDRFQKMTDQINRLNKDLTARDAEIKQQKDQYQAQVNTYNNSMANFQKRIDNKDFSSASEYNRLARQMNGEQRRLNAWLNRLNGQVDAFNRDVQKLNELSQKFNGLNASMNSMQEVE